MPLHEKRNNDNVLRHFPEKTKAHLIRGPRHIDLLRKIFLGDIEEITVVDASGLPEIISDDEIFQALKKHTRLDLGTLNDHPQEKGEQEKQRNNLAILNKALTIGLQYMDRYLHMPVPHIEEIKSYSQLIALMRRTTLLSKYDGQKAENTARYCVALKCAFAALEVVKADTGTLEEEEISPVDRDILFFERLYSTQSKYNNQSSLYTEETKAAKYRKKTPTKRRERIGQIKAAVERISKKRKVTLNAGGKTDVKIQVESRGKSTPRQIEYLLSRPKNEMGNDLLGLRLIVTEATLNSTLSLMLKHLSLNLSNRVSDVLLIENQRLYHDDGELENVVQAAEHGIDRARSTDAHGKSVTYLISHQDPKSTSSGKFPMLKIEGNIRIPSTHYREGGNGRPAADHIRRFEIQFVVESNKNDSGWGRHELHELRGRLFARTRATGGFDNVTLVSDAIEYTDSLEEAQNALDEYTGGRRIQIEIVETPPKKVASTKGEIPKKRVGSKKVELPALSRSKKPLLIKVGNVWAVREVYERWSKNAPELIDKRLVQNIRQFIADGTN